MKKILILFLCLATALTLSLGTFTTYSFAAEEYAWVLVDRYDFPIPDGYKNSDEYFGKLEANTIEIKSELPYGVGIYASRDYDNPKNLHAKYTWSNPPSTIKANETISLKYEQSVISNKTGNYATSFSPFIDMDSDSLSGLEFATSSKVNAKMTYSDGTVAKAFGLGWSKDDRSQSSVAVNATIKFRDKASEGDKHAIYIGVYGGYPGSIGAKYTYEWKKISGSTTPTNPTNNLGKYSWQGEWDTNWGKMILTQNDNIVTGTYVHDSGKISGKVSGNKLTGTWSESPSYAAPNDAGDIEFTMSNDGKSFTGSWRYGSSGSWSNWEGGKRLTEVIPPVVKPPVTPPSTSKNNAEVFESGARIMWQPANGLGYRLFRSTSSSDLGISVTDFYITSTSYADVNIEPNTTYHYTVKPVLSEARPFDGVEEKLGATIAKFTIKTGNSIANPDSFKHFIMLKLDDPYMSVDGIKKEIDPGFGTRPLTIGGRTMIPIRAVVESMGGTVSWEPSTKKITLKAKGNTVEMWLGKKELKLNGVSKKIDVAPVVKNNRTVVPVRFVGENLKSKVDWINSTKEVVIVYEE